MARFRAPFLVALALLLAGCGGTDLTMNPGGTSVAVSPQSITIQPGATTAFSALVSGNKNQSVTWSVVGGATHGVFTGATGLYTAPLTAGTYTIVATSVADPGKAGLATALVVPPAAVTVLPSSLTMFPKESRPFTASISNTNNQSVIWSVLGGAVNGSFDGASGVYTAPDRTGTFTVVATSASDPSLYGTATVTVSGPIAVTVSPNPATLPSGGTQTFSASVTGTTLTSVDWNVLEAEGGTIDHSTGVYTAPLTPGTYTVKATSRANGTSFGIAKVNVSPNSVSLTLSPPALTLDQGESQLFTANILGTPNTSVSWSVNGASPITQTGPFLFTAPALPGTYILRASSAAVPSAQASATITVNRVTVGVLSPTNAVAPTGGSVPFTAQVTGTTDQAITWSVLAGGSGGTINPSGLYTAPVKTGTDTVVATASADSKASNFALVTVGKVTISPSNPTSIAASSGRISFSAVVSGVDDPNIAWKIFPEDSDGSISSSGYFSAPSLPGVYRVRATSTVNPALYGEAQVTVTGPVVVQVSPNPAIVAPGGALAFTASVSGITPTSVTWTILESGGGTINATTGAYTAPSVPGTFTIKATSTADGTSVGTARVMVSSVSLAITPASVSLDQGASQLFVPTLTGTSNALVGWSVNGGAITSQSGPYLYTAPASAGSYVLQAVPAAAPSVFATSIISVNPVSVSVLTPSAPIVSIGGSLAFSATVTGTTNKSVTWSVLKGGAGGTINTSGVYLAPSSTGTDTIVATSSADAKATLATLVTVAKITLSPAAPSVVPATNGRITFTAVVTGLADTGVDWSILPAPNDGSISSSGYFSAPSTPGIYRVRATSKTTPFVFGEVQVTVGGPVQVLVSPNAPTIIPGGSQTFSAAVTGITPTTVDWSVVEFGGGNIDPASGIYTAPLTPGNYTVKATSKADATSYGTVLVAVRAIDLSLSPTSVTLDQGGSQLFLPTLTGTSNPSVGWSVNGGATTTQTGPYLYTAPALAGTYLLKAVPVAATNVQATATIVVRPVAVGAITPQRVAFPQGASYSIPFSATVTGTTQTRVFWTVLKGGAGGSINASGVYTSLSSPGTDTIVATSAADGTTASFALVTIGNITISPSYNSAQAAGTGHISFSTVVTGVTDPTTGLANTTVLWEILPVENGGSITSVGYFTAPTLPGVYRVRASSVVNPALFSEVPVTVF